MEASVPINIEHTIGNYSITFPSFPKFTVFLKQLQRTKLLNIRDLRDSQAERWASCTVPD